MLALLLAVVALVCGVVGIVEGGVRNWAAWGVIALAAVHLLGVLGS